MSPFSEAYVSVDVETAGPNPSQYSLLSIGACLVATPERGFYVELQPVSHNADPEALAVNRLSLERLAEAGLPPGDAMARFETWLAAELRPGERPVFVAHNGAFDWMFVNDYFHRFLGRNPFGHTALDTRSYYMGVVGVPWAETSMRHMIQRYGGSALTHNALEDARDQAELFRRMLAEAAERER